MLLALVFSSDEFAQKVIAACIKKGVITDWFLFAANRLRICPPLTITEEELLSACHVVLAAIDECYQVDL